MNYIEGTYAAKIVGGEMDTSKVQKTPYMNVTIGITHIRDGDRWADADQAQRHLNLYTSPKAWPYTEKKLLAMGFNGDFNNPQFSETQVVVVCRVEIYKDKPQEKWDLPGGEYEAKPPAEDEIKKLNARWATNRLANPPAHVEEIPETQINADVNGTPPADNDIDPALTDDDVEFLNGPEGTRPGDSLPF